jgi:hypothetical protein
LIFSTTLSNIAIILRTTQRDIIKTCGRLYVK